jgi:hypothetical protein
MNGLPRKIMIKTTTIENAGKGLNLLEWTEEMSKRVKRMLSDLEKAEKKSKRARRPK